MINTSINWPSFLAQHDLLWKTMPASWEEAPFTGNGQIGAMIFTSEQKDAPDFRWHMGRTDVAINGLWGGPQRVPIGDLVLKTGGKVLACNMRQDLWNAEVTGVLKTDKGSISFSSFTHTDHMVHIIEVQTAGEEKTPVFEWVSPDFVTCSFWKNCGYLERPSSPPSVTIHDGVFHVLTQKLAKDSGEFAVVWCVVPGRSGSSVVYLDVGYSQQGGAARKEAMDAVKTAMAVGIENLRTTHRAWWNNYYPASFLSVPDARLESFYWIQMYRIASSTRADRMPIDGIGGPWCTLGKFPWKHIHWDLNQQLTYWPMMGANRLDMGESLYRMLDKNVDHLIENVIPFDGDSAGMGVETFLDCRTGSYPEGEWLSRDCPCLKSFWLGNLPWALNNYWRHNRHAMDDTRLRENIFPLLRRSINLYIHHLKTGEDGKLHIFNSISPEYTFYYVTDSNYDLALLRWGCQTLLAICARLNIADPLMAKWKDILKNLTPYPTDENGLMVAAEWPFAKSHRHYSHLLAFYPLYLLNPEQEQDVPLLTRSLDHWTKLFKGGDDCGYSNTGAASMCAALGRGDEALMWLNRYRNITANAMEIEADSPVSEACFSGAQSVHDMLFSCWGDTIRIFPGLPTAWKDAVFHDMRTEGAFLISAQRKNGTTKWVRVKSLAGEPCRVKPSLPGKVRANVAGKSFVLDPIGDGVYLLPLKKGEEIHLYQDGTQPDIVVMPLPHDLAMCNSWGR